MDYYEAEPWDDIYDINFLMGEMGNKDEPTKKQSYMIYPTVKLPPNLEVLTRYDHWAPDTDNED